MADHEYIRNYHSALMDANDLPDESITEHETDAGSVLFQHDILDGLDERFERADVVYTEPAWRNGWETFMNRVGVTQTADYADYIGIQESIIRTLDVPAFMIGGRHSMDYLEPDNGYEVWFEVHDCEAWVYTWNGASIDPYEVETVLDTLFHVVENYEWACDWNCGWGRTPRAMHEAGKQYVCSDVNGRCLAQIAADLYGVRADD